MTARQLMAAYNLSNLMSVNTVKRILQENALIRRIAAKKLR